MTVREVSSADITRSSGVVMQDRVINTTSPLTGGGTLAADMTLSIPAATSSVSGYLSSIDWAIFNSKADSLPQLLGTTATPQFARLGLGAAADTTAELNLNTGTVKVAGAVAKRTLVLSAAGGWGSTTTGATGPTKAESATNKQNVQTLDFADSGAKVYAEWGVFMPGSWDASTITAKFIWLVNSTSTNGVVWGLQARAYGDSSTLDQAFGTAQEATDIGSGTANQVLISPATSAITIGGSPSVNQYVQFRCYRDSNNGSDTLGASISLLAIQISFGISTYSD